MFLCCLWEEFGFDCDFTLFFGNGVSGLYIEITCDKKWAIVQVLSPILNIGVFFLDQIMS